jgi:hypothetical protein
VAGETIRIGSAVDHNRVNDGLPLDSKKPSVEVPSSWVVARKNVLAASQATEDEIDLALITVTSDAVVGL